MTPIQRLLPVLVVLLVTAIARADDRTIGVQLVYNHGRNPKPIFNQARKSFEEIGIKIRYKRGIPANIPYSPPPGGAMYFTYADRFSRYSKPGVITVAMPRPVIDVVSGGIAQTCSNFAVANWGRDRRVASWILAHEIGHLLGSGHDSNPSLMMPIVTTQYRSFSGESYDQIHTCLTNQSDMFFLRKSVCR